MTIRKFYNDMRDILLTHVMIVHNGIFYYEGYIDEKRIYEYLMDCEIEKIYTTEVGLGIVLKEFKR